MMRGVGHSTLEESWRVAVATSLSVAVVIAVLPVAWRRYTEWSRENDVGVEARRLFNTEHIYLPLLDPSLCLSLSPQGRNAIVLQRAVLPAPREVAREDGDR